jgi:DNA-binding protein YbaB
MYITLYATFNGIKKIIKITKPRYAMQQKNKKLSLEIKAKETHNTAGAVVTMVLPAWQRGRT